MINLANDDMKVPRNSEIPGIKKEPKQKRSVITRQKITDAAMDLFSEFGYDETSITMITDRAGVALGSFYSHFENKWEVFILTLENHMKQTTENAGILFEKVTSENMQIEEAIDFLVSSMFLASKRNLRLYFERRQLIITNERVKKIYYAEEGRGLIFLKEYFLQYRDRIKVADLDYAIYIILQMVFIIYISLYQDPSLDPDRMLKELSASVKSILLR